MDVASDEMWTFSDLVQSPLQQQQQQQQQQQLTQDQKQLNQSQTTLFIASTLCIDWSDLIYALWLLRVVTLAIKSLLQGQVWSPLSK